MAALLIYTRFLPARRYGDGDANAMRYELVMSFATDRLLAFISAAAPRIAGGATVVVADGAESGSAAFCVHTLRTGRVHEQVLFVSVVTASSAHVPASEWLHVVRPAVALPQRCTLHFVTLRFGFCDSFDVPATLANAWERGRLAFDPALASYVCADDHVLLDRRRQSKMSLWRRAVFCFLASRQTSVTERFCLPRYRTVTYLLPVSV